MRVSARKPRALTTLGRLGLAAVGRLDGVRVGLLSKRANSSPVAESRTMVSRRVREARREATTLTTMAS